jgi:hypothetical protein
MSSDQADDGEEEHYIIYDYDAELQREWAEEREQERLNTYRNARQLHPSYVFNKDIDTHLENLNVESKRIQDNVQRISNLISNLNLENYYQPNLTPKQSKPKSTITKPKPKRQRLSIQESIDLQEKILSGSSSSEL